MVYLYPVNFLYAGKTYRIFGNDALSKKQETNVQSAPPPLKKYLPVVYLPGASSLVLSPLFYHASIQCPTQPHRTECNSSRMPSSSSTTPKPKTRRLLRVSSSSSPKGLQRRKLSRLYGKRAVGMGLPLALGSKVRWGKGKRKGKGQDRLPCTNDHPKDRVYLLRTMGTATLMPRPSRQRGIGEIYS